MGNCLCSTPPSAAEVTEAEECQRGGETATPRSGLWPRHLVHHKALRTAQVQTGEKAYLPGAPYSVTPHPFPQTLCVLISVSRASPRTRLGPSNRHPKYQGRFSALKTLRASQSGEVNRGQHTRAL